MRQDVNRAIDDFRLRLGLLYLLKYGLAALAVWAFIYGSAILALRGGLGFSRLDVLWGIASLPLVGVVAGYLAWRRLPTSDKVRVVLDQHGRCGGLLMAETPIGDWNEALPELRQPALRWKSGPSWALVAAGVAFLSLALALPQGFANLGGPRLDVSREVEKLEKQLETLEKEKLLEKQRAVELQEQLEQVRRDAKGRDPVKTLEALDHLQDLANKAGKDAAESAARKMEDLGRAEKLAEAVEKLGKKLDAKQLGEAMKELAALAKRADAERDLMDALDPDIQKALEAGKLTPEMMKKLMEGMKDAKNAKLAKMAKLMKAKLIDAKDLAKCEKAGKCDCAGLAAFLKENGCKDGLCDAIALIETPGNGDATRGPGPAKLTFGDESSEDGFKFKEEELPASELEKLKESTLSGISVGKPNIGKEKPVAGESGALAGSKSGGGSANTQMVLPRHRGAVERYFERKMK